MKFAGLLLFAFLPIAALSQQYTRGLGVYPGNPRQYDGPTLTVDATAYRNLALHRPAYQSSAYDYNLTAQLVTDGIKEHDLPSWVVTSTSERGELPKNERGVFLDGNIVSSINVGGDHPWVELDIEGGGAPPQIDQVDVSLRKIYAPPPAGGWSIVVSGSNDRTQWKEVGRFTGTDFPGAHDSGPGFTEPVQFSGPVNFRAYRVEFSAVGVKSWGVGDLKLLNEGREVHIAGPQVFSSAWMSAGSGEEWVSIDLGATCTFDRVVLAWVRRAAEGTIQTSNDGAQWNALQALPDSEELQDDIHLAKPVRARWVRVLMTRPIEVNGLYILSEIEVYGRGDRCRSPRPLHCRGQMERCGSPAGSGACSVRRWCRPMACNFPHRDSPTRIGWSLPCLEPCSQAT